MQLLTEARPEELRGLVARDEFFWLDLLAPSEEEIRGLVDAMGLDPEAAERVLEFGRTPQLRRYRGHIGLIFYGARSGAGSAGELVEVHAYVSGGWLLTIRRDACDPLDELRRELSPRPPPAEESLVGLVLEALAESFDNLLDPLDEEIERIESRAAVADEQAVPRRDLRRQILERRGRLLRVRRLVRRQRDYVDRAVDELADLPGLSSSHQHELRDAAGQMIRVGDRLDEALDRLAAALDLLNSTLANRLNEIMARLTVVATIFLPLTVVTGFFGQNFGWMVDRIDTFAAFLALGIGVFAASGLAIYVWLVRLDGGAGD